MPTSLLDGVIEVTASDGTTLRSRPMGISHFDGETSVTIAELKETVGRILPTKNQILYPDAFTDVKADILVTYKKGGVECDLVFRQRPPAPAEFAGLDATDNWLRCWFLDIDAKAVKLTVPSKLDQWRAAMTRVFHELHRVLKPGGHVAFEVGEIHAGMTKLEQTVLPCGLASGLTPLLVLINAQEFTKTANCWGVDNMAKGTNTNRIVLFQKG